MRRKLRHQGNMGNYWKLVFIEAWRAYKLRLREGRRHLIAFIIQTTILFGLLYFLPWLGDVKDESRLAVATVAAVIVSGALTFLWEFLKAPATLYRGKASHVDLLESALKINSDRNATRIQGEQLIAEGKWSYQAAHGADRERNFREWSNRVVGFLSEHYTQIDVANFLTGHRFDPSLIEWSDLDFMQRIDRLSIIVPFPPEFNPKIADLPSQLKSSIAEIPGIPGAPQIRGHNTI